MTQEATLTKFLGPSPTDEKCRTLFTIGYQGRTIDELISILINRGINFLADVRKDPYSRYKKEFNKNILANKLAESKIKYSHISDLGVKRAERQKLKQTGDYQNYFKSYEESLTVHPELLFELAELSNEHNICLMCFERDYTKCHRQVIADKLLSEGFKIIHL